MGIQAELPRELKFAIIPVIDVMGGIVVRAVGGRRNEYRPIRSRLTDSIEPVAVAHAMLAAVSSLSRSATTPLPLPAGEMGLGECSDTSELSNTPHPQPLSPPGRGAWRQCAPSKVNEGVAELYVADLDGIVKRCPSQTLANQLAAVPARVLLDVGIRTANDPELGDWRHFVPVMGTETVENLELIRHFPNAVLSLDLFDGNLIGNASRWIRDVENVVSVAVNELGIREVIVLDIARVGEGNGPGTERHIESLARRYPEVRLIAGGGVRGWEDCRRLADAGASAALVSTAIHNGNLASGTA